MLNLLSSNVSAIVDGVALGFLALFALFGLFKGLVNTLFKVCGTLFSILLAALLCSTVAGFLQEQFGLINTISDWLSGVLGSLFGEELMSAPLSSATEGALSEAGVAGFVIQIVLSLKGDKNIPEGTTLSQIICPAFAYYIVIILAFIVLFILFKLIFKILSNIILHFFEFKPLKILDKLLGLIFGAVRGVLNFEILVTFLTAIPIAIFQDVSAAVQVSSVAKIFMDINLSGILMSAFANIDVASFVKAIVTVV